MGKASSNPFALRPFRKPGISWLAWLEHLSEMILFRFGTEVFIYLFISDSVHYKWYFFLQNIIIGSSVFHNYDSYTVVLKKKQHLLAQSSHDTGTFDWSRSGTGKSLFVARAGERRTELDEGREDLFLLWICHPDYVTQGRLMLADPSRMGSVTFRLMLTRLLIQLVPSVQNFQYRGWCELRSHYRGQCLP